MSIVQGQIQAWLKAPEDEHLEFKEAKNHFDFEELVRYCAALANEGGGRMILGITNKRPRKVVGSQAFGNLEKTKAVWWNGCVSGSTRTVSFTRKALSWFSRFHRDRWACQFSTRVRIGCGAVSPSCP
jgi:hypothetical protein